MRALGWGTDRTTLAIAVGTVDVGSGVVVERSDAVAVAVGSGVGQRPVAVAPGFFVFVAGRIDR